MNPAQLLYRTAQNFPDSPALFLGKTCVASYADFALQAVAISHDLLNRGIKRGDHVAVFMTNTPEYLVLLYGIWWAGGVAVPMNAKLHVKEAAWIITNAECKLVFTDHREMPSAMSNLDITVLAPSSLPAPAQNLTPPAGTDTHDVVWLFYTSGTTGQPKGVMITAGNIASMMLCYFADVDNVSAQDAILYAAPMSHGAGLYNFMHVLKAARHVVPESGGFDGDEILDLSAQLGSVSMFAAPTMVRRLVDCAKRRGENGQGIRTIVYAGGPMYQADIIDAVDVMGDKFIQIYGQGECPMGITALPRDIVADRLTPNWQSRLNSVGRAQSDVEVEIRDASGEILPRGAIGEITVRGRTVMHGYWNNPKATSKTLRDGWLWTGDVGAIDDQGYLTLHDRSKDVIISGGSNIYPREVEEVILAHPHVQEVSVIGQPDLGWGEVVVAFVVADMAINPADLDQLCLDHIARFKRPKRYYFVQSLPKNNYGKVVKTQLREMLTTIV